jgi:hypothetical protein
LKRELSGSRPLWCRRLPLYRNDPRAAAPFLAHSACKVFGARPEQSLGVIRGCIAHTVNLAEHGASAAVVAVRKDAEFLGDLVCRQTLRATQCQLCNVTDRPSRSMATDRSL